MKTIRRPFGKGKAVSLFTLGTMRALQSEKQMYDVVKTALSIGINNFETAPAYGPAESLLGKAFKKLKNQGKEPYGGYLITSKILPNISLKEGKQQLQEILDRLEIKKIENLAIHGINLEQHLDWAIHGEGAKIINWAIEKGIVNQIGFTSHGSFNLISRALDCDGFQFCSLHLHLLEPSKIPLAKKALNRGIGVMAISPVDKGGKLQFPSQTLIEACKPFHPIELAYRFLIGEGISTLTLGASKIEDFNVAKKLINNNYPLNEQTKQALNNLRNYALFRLPESHCGQCRECLPCPKNVPIPELLHMRNLFLGYDLQEFSKERYNLIGKAGHWWESKNASACEECGECLPRCPNNLQIPKLLKETHKLLIDNPRRRLWD